jgi:hypothetical protein
MDEFFTQSFQDMSDMLLRRYPDPLARLHVGQGPSSVSSSTSPPPIVSCLFPSLPLYSLLKRAVEETVTEFCRKHDVSSSATTGMHVLSELW